MHRQSTFQNVDRSSTFKAFIRVQWGSEGFHENVHLHLASQLKASRQRQKTIADFCIIDLVVEMAIALVLIDGKGAKAFVRRKNRLE